MNQGRFSQSNEDACRLPEGMRRVAYDADTQRYTFRDCSGKLYQSAPGSEYGVLQPVTAPLPHRRSVTITEIPDPALRQYGSEKPAKTFGDILPSGYITAAQSGVESPTSVRSASEKLVQAAMPKVQGVVEIVRRRTTIRRPKPPFAGGGELRRSDTFGGDEKRALLEEEEDGREAVSSVRKGDGRRVRSKSEILPWRYTSGK